MSVLFQSLLHDIVTIHKNYFKKFKDAFSLQTDHHSFLRMTRSPKNSFTKLCERIMTYGERIDANSICSKLEILWYTMQNWRYDLFTRGVSDSHHCIHNTTSDTATHTHIWASWWFQVGCFHMPSDLAFLQN